MNDRLLRVLKGQPVDVTPVWLMRQAGRYLPQYRQIRQQAGQFLNLCKIPELACEVTLQPIEAYPLDAAILFSDILVIPDAMELGLYFEEGEGPKFRHPLRTTRDIEKLPIPDPYQTLSYVLQGVKHVKNALAQRVPLIGFSGSPWTLATYMVEGGSSKTFARIKTMMYQDPQLLHVLLEKLADSVTAYLKAQILAGVDVVMLFDTWGGVLTPSAYQTFSLHYMKKIIQALAADITIPATPVILFTKGGGAWLEEMAASGCHALGIDWSISLQAARARVPESMVLQGNLDPSELHGKPADIRAAVKRVLAEYGHGHRHIFNLGHGITPDINPDAVAVLVDAVHEYSAIYHR